MIKKSRLRIRKEKKGRRVIVYLFIFAVLGVVGYQFQKYNGITTYIQEVLHNLKTTFSSNDPVRGTFYDRNFKQLAVTLERVSVYARTREIDSIQETATQLGRILVLDSNNLEDQLEGGTLRLWIAKDISQEQEEAIKELQLPGVYLQKDDKRYYPHDFQAAHFIGYVEDGIGLSGVEFYYDRLLANRKLNKQEESQPLSGGLDLVLTIDLKIQSILEDIAEDIAENEQAEKVAAYLLEAETGEIIGGANLPGFNPNTFARYSQEQTENMFLVPLCMPDKFRVFLRDATMLHAYESNDVSTSAWSVLPENNTLGSQLRLWESLGMNDSLETDFYVPPQPGKAVMDEQQPVNVSTTNFGFVPNSSSPLSLLSTYSVLLNKGKKIHPFIVKKAFGESGLEVLLNNEEAKAAQVDSWSDAGRERVTSLFQSMATKGTANTFYFRDDILVSIDKGGSRQLLFNDLLFVTVPAENNDLNMLVVVQRGPQGVEKKDAKSKKTIEQIVEEKVERISVLQQIAKSVADVVEPEMSDEDNYQGKNLLITGMSRGGEKGKTETPAPGVMPDLRGLSLRKSLRLLQGKDFELKIQGTGRVIDQKPRPGSSLKGITECLLILERQEKIAPGKFGKRPKEKASSR
ncbi:MAG: PASTA domain-containing protein [Desulforhopalus sp.]